MKETNLFLKSLLKHGDTIIIGVSGGPDSMCLLHVLKTLKKELDLKIVCAHVNHGLRVESEKEAKFVENFCVFNNIIFEYMKIDAYKNNKFTEDEARSKRYNFFEDLISKYNAKYLMTAHHGNDLEETILMRIVRGSNLKGYIGIPMVSDNGKYKIVRPLLNLNKSDILDYLKENNIKYVLDGSNSNEKYTRNRFRKHVLPFLEKEDKNVHIKFLKFSEELSKYQKYINKIIDDLIDRVYKDNKIDLNILKREDIFIQEKVIERIIEIIQKKDVFNINDKQFVSIMVLLNNDTNKQINLSDNFIARRSYNYLIIEKNKNIETYNYIFDESIIINDRYRFEKIDDSNIKNNFIIRLNSEEVNLPLIIRPYKQGDKIKVKNLNGTKKVSDIFIDSKIDAKIRKTYPIVLDSKENVIWVPGIKKSIFDKEISEKYDIILKYTEECYE